MELNAAAEELPALYRAILDRVAQMEASGDRDGARHLRRQAIRIYSRSWDARSMRHLDDLLRHFSDEAVRLRPAGRVFRRRTISAL